MFYKSLLQFSLMFIFLLFSLVAAANCIVLDASINSGGPEFLAWLVKNWYQVALVISEICALLPGKYSGIIKTLLALISELIKNFRSQQKISQK